MDLDLKNIYPKVKLLEKDFELSFEKQSQATITPPKGQEPIFKKLVNNLYVGYIVDQGDRYSYFKN